MYWTSTVDQSGHRHHSLHFQHGKLQLLHNWNVNHFVKESRILKRDIHACLHHGWANSLVDVRDTTPPTPAFENTIRPWRQHGHTSDTNTFREVSDDSGGAASVNLRTVPNTSYRSFAQAVQGSSEFSGGNTHHRQSCSNPHWRRKYTFRSCPAQSHCLQGRQTTVGPF